MPRFFLEPPVMEPIVLQGENARHIALSLRMKAGDALTVCDGQGTDFECTIASITPQQVELAMVHKIPTQSEPTVRVTLYQGVPKSDKFDTVVQKAVELGVSAVVPVMMSRCVSRPDAKSMEKKCIRWQKIAAEAAKQSGRGIVPQVMPCITFAEALRTAGGQKILFYECGGTPLTELVSPDAEEISLFIGPEGGISGQELEAAVEAGAQTATLGPRILRTETAPLAALTAVMLLTDNLK